MAGRFRVVPEQLTTAATTLAQEARRLASETEALREAAATAELAAGNGLAEGAISDVTRTWRQVLERLGGRLEADAEGLRSCATIYREADGRSSSAADRVMRALES